MQCKVDSDGDWSRVKLISRAGKRTGKYKNEWNVEDLQGRQNVLDFDHVEWHKTLPQSNDNMEAPGSSETMEEVELILQNEIMKEDILYDKKREEKKRKRRRKKELLEG